MAETELFRVIMWCVPRSISTAIAKAFSFIDNTEVWFEPYCQAFFAEFMLKSMGISLPKGADDLNPDALLTQMGARMKGSSVEHMFNPDENDMSLFTRGSITRQLDSPPNKHVFIKDMAYSITGYLDLLPKKEAGFKHTFLIRDPERMFPSWRNLLMAQVVIMAVPGQTVDVDPATFDMTTDVPFMMPGYTYKCQYDLWKYVKEHIDSNPVVMDVDELLANPAEMLPKYFQVCGMPWDPKYLEWDGNPDIAKSWRSLHPVKGTEAKDFGAGVPFKKALWSKEFSASNPKIPRSEMTPDSIKAIDATTGFYKEMAQTRIQI